METVAFCEIDPFCQKVLRKHWPNVPIYEDIKTLRGDEVGSVDVVCGGFPCQPFSCAGKRQGKEDDRFLWPELLRVIKVVKPRWLCLENVTGLGSMAQQHSDVKVESKTIQRLEESDYYQGIFTRQEILLLSVIIEDIEKAGYELPEQQDGTPIIPVLPACAVGAPHRRDRIWIIAHRTDAGLEVLRQERENTILQIPSDCHAPHATSREPWKQAKSEGWEDIGRGSWQEPWIEVAPRLCRMDARVPDRVDRLKCLGNAVVPQIVEVIGRCIIKAEYAMMPQKREA